MFTPALEKAFNEHIAKPMAEKAQREVLTPDQARNADRLKRYEEKKMEQSK